MISVGLAGVVVLVLSAVVVVWSVAVGWSVVALWGLAVCLWAGWVVYRSVVGKM